MPKEIIRKLGLVREYNDWLKKVKNTTKFSIGTKVRFKKTYFEGFPYSADEGDVGIIVPTDRMFFVDVIQINTERSRVPLWRHELEEYLEIV